jgi:hypothetical protein
MDERPAGNPEDLADALRNWLRQAQSPTGTLPAGTDPIAWAVERFIAYWANPARSAIRSIERSLSEARALCDAGGSPTEIKAAIEYAMQVIGEDLRDHLGLYQWDEADA